MMSSGRNRVASGGMAWRVEESSHEHNAHYEAASGAGGEHRLQRKQQRKQS
jgi:hypothetical protein